MTSGADALSPISAALQVQSVRPEVEIKIQTFEAQDIRKESQNSPTRIVHHVPPTFKTKLAEVTYKIISKWNEDVSRYPLDARITILFETLKPFIEASQKQLKELKEKSEKAGQSCFLQKPFTRAMIITGAISVVAVITSNAISIVQCDAAQSSVTALVASVVGGAISSIKDYFKDRKDEEDEAAKKAERDHKEKELQHVTQLWDFLSTLVNISQTHIPENQARPRSHEDCTREIVHCAERLRAVPDVYRKNLQTVESLVSNLITRLPESHPIQRLVFELYEIAQKQLNPVHVQQLNTSGSISLGDVSLRWKGQPPETLEKTHKEYQEATSSAMPQRDDKQKLETELEKQYQGKWKELEQLLPTTIDYVDFQNIRLTKKGASYSPKHTAVELVTARSTTHIEMCPPTPKARNINSARQSPELLDKTLASLDKALLASLQRDASPMATTTLFSNSPAAPSKRPPGVPKLFIPPDRRLLSMPAKRGSGSAPTAVEAPLGDSQAGASLTSMASSSTSAGPWTSMPSSTPMASWTSMASSSTGMASSASTNDFTAQDLAPPITFAASAGSISSDSTETLRAAIQRVVSNPLMPIVPLNATSQTSTDGIGPITSDPVIPGASDQVIPGEPPAELPDLTITIQHVPSGVRLATPSPSPHNHPKTV